MKYDNTRRKLSIDYNVDVTGVRDVMQMIAEEGGHATLPTRTAAASTSESRSKEVCILALNNSKVLTLHHPAQQMAFSAHRERHSHVSRRHDRHDSADLEQSAIIILSSCR